MGRWVNIALILLATFACACGGGGGTSDGGVTPDGAWAELGTGTNEFEELQAEADLVLVAGPQGGHHFILTARMRGLEPGDPTQAGAAFNPTTRFSVWDEGGQQLDIDPPPYRLGYEEVGDGVYAMLGGRIIQVREEEVAALYGGRVKVRVEIEDNAGAHVMDERWIRPIEDTSVPNGDAGVPDAGPPAAWVEIGTADDSDDFVAFVPLADEGDIVRHAGPQGGNHFFLQARMMGLDPEIPTTRLRVYNEGGNPIDIGGNVTLSYEDAGGGTYALPYGQVVQLSPVPSIGARVRVTVELTDTDGLQVTDERWVTAVEP